VSHLTSHLDSASALRDWKMEDLWEVVSSAALLSRPLNEPWQEFHAAIRRLLFRYYYRTDEERAEAHSGARQFVQDWVHDQNGTERAIGLVECVWHEATVLSIRRPIEMEPELIALARNLSAEITESAAYKKHELRLFASERMVNNEEFEQAVSAVDGLLARLVDAVMAPLQEL
jgi:hypothetical protein